MKISIVVVKDRIQGNTAVSNKLENQSKKQKMNESLFKSRKIQTPISNVAAFFSKRGTFNSKDTKIEDNQYRELKKRKI